MNRIYWFLAGGSRQGALSPLLMRISRIEYPPLIGSRPLAVTLSKRCGAGGLPNKAS